MRREINNYTLSVDKKHIIFEHEDPYGGCSHALSVYKIKQLLKNIDKAK
jgi:RAB protein geranylgeranyltransferase component A